MKASALPAYLHKIARTLKRFDRDDVDSRPADQPFMSEHGSSTFFAMAIPLIQRRCGWPDVTCAALQDGAALGFDSHPDLAGAKSELCS